MARERGQVRVVGQDDARTLERDARLVRGVLAGDADSLRQLIDHYDRLIRYTVHRSASTACRRDPSFLDACASDAWLGFVESIRRLGSGPNGSLGPYLVQIARNKCLDHLRRVARTPSTEAFEEKAATITADNLDPLSVLLDLERADVLRSCIQKLGDEDRKLLQEMELVADRRWKEAAQRLGEPESTLRSRWDRMLDRLRRCVEKNL